MAKCKTESAKDLQASLRRSKDALSQRRLRKYRDSRERLNLMEPEVWFLDVPLRSFEEECWQQYLESQLRGYDGSWQPEYQCTPVKPVEQWLNKLNDVSGTRHDVATESPAEPPAESTAEPRWAQADSSPATSPDADRFRDWIRILDEEPSMIFAEIERDATAMAIIVALKRQWWPYRNTIFETGGPVCVTGDDRMQPSTLSTLYPIDATPSNTADIERTRAQGSMQHSESNGVRSIVLALIVLGYPMWIRSACKDGLPAEPVSSRQALEHFFGLYVVPVCYYRWLECQTFDPDFYYQDGPTGPDEPRYYDPMRVWPLVLGLPFIGWYVAKAQGLSPRDLLKQSGVVLPKGVLHTMDMVSTEWPVRTSAHGHPTWQHAWGSLEHIVQTELRLMNLPSETTSMQPLRYLVDECLGRSRMLDPAKTDLVRWFVRLRDDVSINELRQMGFTQWYRSSRDQARRDDRAFLMTGRSGEHVRLACARWHAAAARRTVACRLQQELSQRRSWSSHDLDAVIDERWTFMELCDSVALFRQGAAQRNCVLTYAARCLSGKSAIVSVKQDKTTVLTIEIKPENRQIIQIRGRFNSMPDVEQLALVERWALPLGLKMD